MHIFYTRVEFILAGLKARSDGVGRILLGDNMEAEGSCCGNRVRLLLTGLDSLVYVYIDTYVPYSPPDKTHFFSKSQNSPCVLTPGGVGY